MLINFKSGVPGRRSLHPVMSLAAFLLAKYYEEINENFTITSTIDGDHKIGSLHYLGLAVDIRTNDLRSHTDVDMAGRIRVFLAGIDPRFQVIWHKTHIHVEFDRRVNIKEI